MIDHVFHTITCAILERYRERDRRGIAKNRQLVQIICTYLKFHFAIIIHVIFSYYLRQSCSIWFTYFNWFEWHSIGNPFQNDFCISIRNILFMNLNIQVSLLVRATLLLLLLIGVIHILFMLTCHAYSTNQNSHFFCPVK